MRYLPPPAQLRPVTDLVVALGAHLLAAPLWLILAAGVGQSIRTPQGASMARIVSGWSLVAALPLTWFCLGGMLVIWWRQGRGPLWSYPLRWVLMLFLTLIALVALLFPKVRSALVPPRIATA
jgi:hypothetical protein